MKMKSIVSSLAGVGVLMACGFMQAQAGAGGRVDPDQLSKYNNGAATGPQALRDKLFLHKAAEGGLAEVELGKLAAQKGNSPDVKAFGQMMVTDHTKLNASLKPIADAMEASTPKKMAKPDQAEFNKLNGLTGADFDKEYIAYMVTDHEKDLKEFTDEAQLTPDPNLKAAVMDGQKMISQHLAAAQKLAAASSGA